MNKCIVCDMSNVAPFLDLGQTALANKFVTAADSSHSEQQFPLRVGFCQHCGHVQLLDRVSPDAMFSDYLYVSGVSDTLRSHLHDLSDIIVERHRLKSTDMVIDVGCNDGTLLECFCQHGIRVLGVDPALNLAALAQEKQINRHVGFFNLSSAQEILTRYGRASVVTSTNSFPHIQDLHDFMRGIDTVLAPGGTLIIEAHYLSDLLEQVAFDTVYHEHVSYWALKPMMALFARHGFVVTNAERLALHHGQIRVTAQRRGDAAVQPAVDAILAEEAANGLQRFETFVRFAEKTAALKSSLITVLRKLKAQHNRLVGYGAPAKGSTLLSYLGLGVDILDYIADRSPLKQGRFTPGTHIPIVAPAQILLDQPDYVLILAWNFAAEVMAQLAEYQNRNGKFILPVPEVRVIPGHSAHAAFAKAS